MSNASVTIRYDGPALAKHQMDVADLAPALLGISDLCKLANRRFNGDRAALKVLIATDRDHQCFQFSIDVVQTIWQQAQVLLGHEDVKSAKEILEWLGLLGTPVLGLFGLLKTLAGKEVEGTTFRVNDGRDVVQIRVDGDNNQIIVGHRAAYELLQDPSALADAKKVIEPLTKEGYEVVEFESGTQVERVKKQEAAAIYEAAPITTPEIEAELPQHITAWVQVYAPVYDVGASKWQFRYGERHEYMDISDTSIAAKAIERGGALIDDTYKVILEIQQTKTESGRFKVKYRIKEVLEFHPAKIKTQADWIHDGHDELRS